MKHTGGSWYKIEHISQQEVAGSNLLKSAYIRGIVQRESYAFIKPNSAGDIFKCNISLKI